MDALKFATAIAKWTLAGMPTRSEEAIGERLAICQVCPQFDGHACKICGCNCGPDKSIFNKIALATEKCPLRKWK